MRETRAQLEARNCELQDKIEQLEHRLFKTETELGALENQVWGVQDDNWDLREQVEVRQAEISSLTARLDDEAKATKEAVNQMAKLTLEVGRLEYENRLFKRIIDNQLDQIQGLEQIAYDA